MQTHYFPEPFLGNVLDANVILLNLNPGVDELNLQHHQNPVYLRVAIDNLHHQAAQYPFSPINPVLAGMPCHTWWNKKLKRLIEDLSLEQVSQEIACIVLHGYPSIKFNRNVKLESIKYSTYLLKSALNRNALIIIMRGRELWEELVPELRNYQNIMSLNNPQNPCLTPNNIGQNDYHRVKKIYHLQLLVDISLCVMLRFFTVIMANF